MGMPELFLEHKRGGKTHKVLRVKPERELFLIGSSANADLRITGEGVGGCHMALRYRAPHWYLCDLTPNAVETEKLIDGKAAIELVGHRIQLFTKERDTELFKEGEQNGNLALHQVVVRSRTGQVSESHVLGANEPFIFLDGETKTTLRAPTDGKWTKTQVGSRTIQQRLVRSQELLNAEKITFDEDLRKPLAMALMLLFFLIGTVATIGALTHKDKEVVLDKKSQDIIFNAKAVQKKKIEAQKVVKSAKGRKGGTSENAPKQTVSSPMPEESTAPKVSAKASAALTSLRNSGLSNLVGKIAKRANKQGVLVAAQGVSPDVQGAGRAFFSTGTSTVGGGGSASKAGASYKLGGIGTQGKAGGTGNFKDGTALAGGSVGSGNIVALSEEESVVEGGLDRDAIAEVIKRNLGQIRYCYERQLSSNKDLYGKVLVKWTIGAAGDVMEPRVDGSTLKSAMVEGCILRRMASWKFPEPKGGTQVKVSYPFLFKALD